MILPIMGAFGHGCNRRLCIDSESVMIYWSIYGDAQILFRSKLTGDVAILIVMDTLHTLLAILGEYIGDRWIPPTIDQ